METGKQKGPMARYFHVDRRARFVAGQAVDLSRPDLAAVPDLAQHFNVLFPDGVSAHGMQYLNLDVKAGNGEPATELILEYVRRAHFPDRPSRFTATCAWRDLEEARAWRSLAGMPNAKIWTLEAAEGFVANMNLLHVGTSTLRASQFAHAYWAGEEGPKLDGIPPPCWEVLLCGPITVGDEV